MDWITPWLWHCWRLKAHLLTVSSNHVRKFFERNLGFCIALGDLSSFKKPCHHYQISFISFHMISLIALDRLRILQRKVKCNKHLKWHFGHKLTIAQKLLEGSFEVENKKGSLKLFSSQILAFWKFVAYLSTDWKLNNEIWKKYINEWKCKINSHQYTV